MNLGSFTVSFQGTGDSSNPGVTGSDDLGILQK